jgi:type VI secretion system ImpC/EvpB family protein/type VI secretion system ImpB/VipA family protein
MSTPLEATIPLDGPKGKDSGFRPTAGPLRLLVLGDFLAGECSKGAPIPVSAGTLDEVLGSLAPALELEIPDRLGLAGKPLALSLRFRSLSSFDPAGIAEGVPLLAAIAEAHRLALARRDGAVDEVALRERLVLAFGGEALPEAARILATEPASAPGGGGALDSLLSKVELLPVGGPVESPLAPLPLAGLLHRLLEAAAAPSASAIDPVATELERRLGLALGAIVSSERFRELESSWRGLAFLLASAAKGRGAARVELLAAPRGEFLDLFFERVFHAEYELASEVPLGLVLADYAIDRSQPDLDRLQNAARMGASLGVPFVFASSPGYWGIRQASLLATLPDLVEKAKGGEYAKWNRFRGDESSVWVTLVANRFLLRDARPSGDPATGLPLWGSGVWLLGAATLSGFDRDGFALHLTGVESAIEGLPLRPAKSGKGDPLDSPLEVLFTDRKVFELLETGFVPLVGVPGRGAAHLPSVPTFHLPKRYDVEEATRASFLAATFPYQIFAGAVGGRLQRIGRTVDPRLPDDRIADLFREALLAILAESEEQPAPGEIEVEVARADGGAAARDVTVRLRPRFRIQGGEADLLVGISIPD